MTKLPVTEEELGPKTYRLKVPITVQAEKVTEDNIGYLISWCRGAAFYKNDIRGLNVPTLRGVRQAYVGWYIVKKRSGDFEVWEPQPFDAKYILVSQEI